MLSGALYAETHDLEGFSFRFTRRHIISVPVSAPRTVSAAFYRVVGRGGASFSVRGQLLHMLGSVLRQSFCRSLGLSAPLPPPWPSALRVLAAGTSFVAAPSPPVTVVTRLPLVFPVRAAPQKFPSRYKLRQSEGSSHLSPCSKVPVLCLAWRPMSKTTVSFISRVVKLFQAGVSIQSLVLHPGWIHTTPFLGFSSPPSLFFHYFSKQCNVSKSIFYMCFLGLLDTL